MAEIELTEALKGFHRSFPTGVTIVATSTEGSPFGLAVNAFCSVSLDPPMVMVCVKATSSTYEKLFSGDRLGVSILANDQAQVVGVFSKSGIDKFDQVKWSPGETGAPLIDGASAQLEFHVTSRMLAGTHAIFVGEVTHASFSGTPPLIYVGGSLFDGGQLVPV